MFFSVLELIAKLLSYSGFAVIFGGMFLILLYRQNTALLYFNIRYIFVGCLLGFLGTGLYFLVKTGSLAESGWQGMFDPLFMQILNTSSVGDSTQLRINALVMILFGTTLYTLMSRAKPAHLLWSAPALLGIILITHSFSMTGHTVDDIFITRMLLALHALPALIWLGSLIPLWWSCQHLQITTVRTLMERFGQTAMTMVLILLLCGTAVAIQLLNSAQDLIQTKYGLILIAKLLLVILILAFASWHRFSLVRKLTSKANLKHLQGSITLEFIVGIEILIATIMLTTLYGPEQRM